VNIIYNRQVFYKASLFSIVLVLLLVSFTSSAATAENVSPTITETQIASNGSAFNPAIYGDRIVWEDHREDNEYPFISDIYMYDLSTKKETQITTSGSAYSPDIYGDRIVGIDDRNRLYDIYVYDLSTNKEIAIATDQSISYDSPASIYGDRIVWQESGYKIYIYDLSTNKKTEISNVPAWISDMRPDICDDKIVWQDMRNASGEDDGNILLRPDIYMYDVSTNKETRITTSESAGYPSIYGDRIVWCDNDIYMYDLSTSKETQITNSGSSVNGYRSPEIYGDKITWTDTRNNKEGENWDIYMYNLSSSMEIQVTTNKSEQRNPVIHGDRIVWEDRRNGGYPNSDIYMATLTWAEEPPLDDHNMDDSNGTDNETQLPDNDSDNGDETGTDNETQVPDNESDTGTDNGIDNETQIPDNCSSELTPLVRTQALKKYVECTYKCHVKTKTGLATLLDTSMYHYENCDNTKAVSMLKSFIHLAEKMKECKQISADEADYMFREAKIIIDQIETN